MLCVRLEAIVSQIAPRIWKKKVLQNRGCVGLDRSPSTQVSWILTVNPFGGLQRQMQHDGLRLREEGPDRRFRLDRVDEMPNVTRSDQVEVLLSNLGWQSLARRSAKG